MQHLELKLPIELKKEILHSYCFGESYYRNVALKVFQHTKILVIKVSLSAENKMKDITMDNEVGNSAKLFHLECLRCSILKVSLDSMCQCLDEQGKCEDGMKCGICSCRLCRYTEMNVGLVDTLTV